MLYFGGEFKNEEVLGQEDCELHKSCSGTILGFNDYGWKSGTPIE